MANNKAMITPCLAQGLEFNDRFKLTIGLFRYLVDWLVKKPLIKQFKIYAIIAHCANSTTV